MERLIQPNEQGIIRASELLRSGQLVAFPTETVYGLGANALDEKAVRDIFIAKGRPLTDPLIVHVRGIDSALDLLQLNEDEETVFKMLASNCWPGPLTIIAKAKEVIPLCVTANTGFVGVRCPAHSLAMRLLEVCDLPIAAPSANRFGHVSPTKASHVVADLGSHSNVYVLNGDENVYDSETCLHGIESSVVKIDQRNGCLTILRQGAITETKLQQLLNDNRIPWSINVSVKKVNMHSDKTTTSATPSSQSSSSIVGQEAPGQAITHYAPDVPCVIVKSLTVEDMSSDPLIDDALSGEAQNASSHASSSQLYLNPNYIQRHVVVLDFNGQLSPLQNKCLAYRDLSSEGNTKESARVLFESLRWAEAVEDAKRILLPSIPAHTSDSSRETEDSMHDVRLGLIDRVFRAASGNLVDLITTQMP